MMMLRSSSTVIRTPIVPLSYLHNPIYKGEVVWNRSEWVKDHETSKRRRFERPESEWVRRMDPNLRIVSDEVAAAVEEEQSRRGAAYARTEDGRLAAHTARTAKRKHLLAGFLECGTCGGGFYALSRADRYGCAWHRSRGPGVCASTLVVPRLALEDCVLTAIREQILSPDTVAYIVDLALVALAEHEKRRGTHLLRLRKIDRELKNLVRLAAATGDVPEVAAGIAALKAEASALQIAAMPRTPTAELRRRIIEHALQLRSAFDAAPDEARGAMRALLGERRMKVLEDKQHGWRVEGLFEVPLSGRGQVSRPGPLGGGDEVVAGGRYVRDEPVLLDEYAPLPWAA